jgi:uncharacterized protein (DUF488 family)
MMATIYTIGFSGKSADSFMDVLDAAHVKTLIDTRLWRVARFVPWASGTNLQTALGDRYKYMPELAPTRELLSAYKNGDIDWSGYERIFNGILDARKPENLFTYDDLDGICLFCSENAANMCHRRLAAEYLGRNFPATRIVHL